MNPKLYKKISTTIKNPNLVKERQDTIFRAALKLFSKNGYHKTSLRKLSKETGISLGNIYDYIRRKSDILYLLYQKMAEIGSKSWGQRINDIENPMEKLTILIEAELETIDQYQDLVMVIYQESHVMDKLTMKTMLSNEELRWRLFEKILKEGIESRVFLPCNTTAVANIIKLMIDSWVLRRWILRDKVSIAEMKNSIMQILQKGILESV